LRARTENAGHVVHGEAIGATERVEVYLLDPCQVHRDRPDVTREPDTAAVG
jgi:hypothetical protein